MLRFLILYLCFIFGTKANPATHLHSRSPTATTHFHGFPVYLDQNKIIEMQKQLHARRKSEMEEKRDQVDFARKMGAESNYKGWYENPWFKPKGNIYQI